MTRVESPVVKGALIVGTLLVFAMPFIASLGSVVTVAGLAAARPWAAAMLVVSLFAVPRWNRSVKWVAILTVGWSLWGLFTLHDGDKVRQFLSLPLSLLTLLALAIFPWSIERLRWLARGWLFAWVCAIIPALYEIATGEHLPNYLESSPQWLRERSEDIASYFVNPNPFAYFLCASMIVFVMAAELEGKWLRRIMIACAAITPVIIYPTNGRAVLAVSVLILAWLALTRKMVRKHWRVVVAACLIGVLLVMLRFLLVPGVLEDLVGSFHGSGNSRLGLYLNATWMYLSTGGLGVGPGMFEKIMQSGRAPFETEGAINPHSAIFEILSQYGFLVSALLGAALIALTWRTLKLLRTGFDDHRAKPVLQGVFATAVTLPLLTFGDSQFLASPIAWAQIGTMTAFWIGVQDLMKPIPVWSVRREVPELPEHFRVARKALARAGSKPTA